MDQATLVSPDINAGREALAALDAAHLKPAVAAFVLLPEYEDWRLILSSPSLDQTDQLKAYQQVTKALGGRFVYSLPLILILPTRDPFVREVQRIFTRIFGVRTPGREVRADGPVRIDAQRIGNRFISDAYVLRLPNLILSNP